MFRTKLSKCVDVLSRHSAAIGAVIALGTAVGSLVFFFYNALAGIFASPVPDPRPAVITLASDQIAPLDGHPVIKVASYPRVFAGGARIRLALQGRGEEPAQLIRLRIKARMLPYPQPAPTYTVDNRRQPGFGPAQPHVFYVAVLSETSGIVGYARGDEIVEAPFPDLLPSSPAIVFHLDRSTGLQDTIDVNLSLVPAGLFAISFRADFVAMGRTYSQVTEEILVFRQ
jgi:hypothetical protein